MATVIKKISELEHLEELTSSSNVIIEENGEAKRFSAASLGKVKTVNGVEPDENGNIEVEVSSEVEIPEQVNPDWNQNDSTQPDYVKNRTHWVEGSGATIEWDGNTEGRDSFVAEATYYHVSDSTPTIDELIGASYETDMVDSGVSATSITSEMLTVFGDCIAISAGVPLIVIATIDNAATGDSVTTISKAGVYFINAPGYGYASKLTYGSTTYHPLDEAFIPDTIARTADIPEVNYPVTSVNGMTGDVVIEAGSGGGVTSWNDLEDKPFYEEEGKVAVVENQSVTMSGGEAVSQGMIGQTGDPVILVTGKKYAVIVDGVEYELTAQEGTVSGAECVYLGDATILNDNNTSPDVNIVVAYAPAHSMNLVGVVGTITAITLSVYEWGTVAYPLDEKFIPDTIARNSNVTWEYLPDKPFSGDCGSYEWDGEWASLTDTSGMDIKLSEEVPNIEDLIGAEVVIHYKTGDSSFTLDSSNIVQMDKFTYMLIDTNSKQFAYVAYEGSAYYEQGVYFHAMKFVSSSQVIMEYPKKLTYDTTKKIDPKYLPPAPVTSVNGITGDVVVVIDAMFYITARQEDIVVDESSTDTLTTGTILLDKDYTEIRKAFLDGRNVAVLYYSDNSGAANVLPLSVTDMNDVFSFATVIFSNGQILSVRIATAYAVDENPNMASYRMEALNLQGA